MSILDHKRLAIFSYQRSGTKLLASILSDFGYNRFGEWYDQYSNYINNGVATRKSLNNIDSYQKFADKLYSTSLAYYNVMQEKVIERVEKFNSIIHSADRFVITVWPENVIEFPFLIHQLKDVHWLMIERDSFEQLLSWMVSRKNQNFDAKKTSTPIIIEKRLFSFYYWRLLRVKSMQSWLFKNNCGTMIKYDELISGTSIEFGQPYSVNSVDEHVDIKKYVNNIDEVVEWYNELQEQNKTIIYYNY